MFPGSLKGISRKFQEFQGRFKEVSRVGRVEKWKNNILKYADVDYYGTIYIKQGSIEKNRIFKILAGCFFVLKF